MTYDAWNDLKKSILEKQRTYFNKGEIWQAGQELIKLGYNKYAYIGK